MTGLAQGHVAPWLLEAQLPSADQAQCIIQPLRFGREAQLRGIMQTALWCVCGEARALPEGPCCRVRECGTPALKGAVPSLALRRGSFWTFPVRHGGPGDRAPAVVSLSLRGVQRRRSCGSCSCAGQFLACVTAARVLSFSGGGLQT